MEICEIGESRRLAMRDEGGQLSSKILRSFLEGCLTGNFPLTGGSLVALGVRHSHTAFCTGLFSEMLTRTTVQGKVLRGKWREPLS